MGAVIKQDRLVSDEVRLSGFNLEDIREEAKKIRQEALSELDKARQQAEQIIERAKIESQQIIEKAHKEGFDAGFKEGLEVGRQQGRDEALELARTEFATENAKLREALLNLVNGIQTERQHLLARAKQEILALALAISAKITNKQIEIIPDIVEENIKKAVELIGSRSRVIIRLNPKDIERYNLLDPNQAKNLLNEFSEVKFIPDENVSLGGCIVQMEDGEVNADIKVQIDNIINQLVPAMKGLVEELIGTEAEG